MELLHLLPKSRQLKVEEAGNNGDSVVEEELRSYFHIDKLPEAEKGDIMTSLSCLRWFYREQHDSNGELDISPSNSLNYDFKDEGLKSLFEELRQKFASEQRSPSEDDNKSVERIDSLGSCDPIICSPRMISSQHELQKSLALETELDELKEELEDRLSLEDNAEKGFRADMQKAENEISELKGELDAKTDEIAKLTCELLEAQKECAAANADKEKMLMLNETLKNNSESEKHELVRRREALLLEEEALKEELHELKLICESERNAAYKDFGNTVKYICELIQDISDAKKVYDQNNLLMSEERKESVRLRENLEEALKEQGDELQKTEKQRQEAVQSLLRLELEVEIENQEPQKEHTCASEERVKITNLEVEKEAVQGENSFLKQKLARYDELIETMRNAEKLLAERLKCSEEQYESLSEAISSGKPPEPEEAISEVNQPNFALLSNIQRQLIDYLPPNAEESIPIENSDFLAGLSHFLADNASVKSYEDELSTDLDNERRQVSDLSERLQECEFTNNQLSREHCAFKSEVLRLRQLQRSVLFGGISEPPAQSSQTIMKVAGVTTTRTDFNATAHNSPEMNAEYTELQTLNSQQAALIIELERRLPVQGTNLPSNMYNAQNWSELPPTVAQEPREEPQGLLAEDLEISTANEPQIIEFSAERELNSVQERLTEALAEVARLRQENVEIQQKEHEELISSANRQSDLLETAENGADAVFRQQNELLEQIRQDLINEQQEKLALKEEMRVKRREAEKRVEEARRSAQNDKLVMELQAKLKQSELLNQQLNEQKTQWKSDAQLKSENSTLKEQLERLRGELEVTTELESKSRLSQLDDARDVEILQVRIRELEQALHAKESTANLELKMRQKEEVLRLNKKIEYMKAHPDPTIEAEMRAFQEAKAYINQYIPGTQRHIEKLQALCATTQFPVSKQVISVIEKDIVLCKQFLEQTDDELISDIIRSFGSHFGRIYQILTAGMSGTAPAEVMALLADAHSQLRAQLLE